MPDSPHAIALYEESYCRLKVLIIADFSDAEQEYCVLQVLENVGIDGAPCAPLVGSSFTFRRRRDIHCHGMGRLIRDIGDAR